MAGSTQGRRVASWLWWQPVLAGLAHALLMALAFPPAGVWLLAFVAPLPLLWAACRVSERPILGALLTGIGVAPLWFFEQRWLLEVTALGYPFLAVYLSVCTAFGVYLVARIRRRAVGFASIPLSLLAPIGLGAAEVLRGEVILTGYPWFLAAHPLVESPYLAAPAAVLGTYFVSFLVYAMAGAAADAAGWSGVHRTRGGQAALIVALLWAGSSWSAWRIGRPRAPVELHVAVVQTNILQSNKTRWELDERRAAMRRFTELTRQAAGGRPAPDLILWPETMFPGITLSGPAIDEFDALWSANNPGRVAAGERHPLVVLTHDLLKLQAEVGVPMIVGSIAMPEPPPRLAGERPDRLDFGPEFNSAFLVASGRVQAERYDKVDLTPFGEVIPYAWRWPALQQKLVNLGAAGMAFSLARGTEPIVLPIDATLSGDAATTRVPLATPICFEATRASLCRWLVYDGPTRRAAALVNLSNDGWFGHFTGGREQHLQAARWRCVELGVPMVRAVNSGISAHIDDRGRLIKRGPDNRASAVETDGVMSVTLHVDPMRRPTTYGRIGDVWAWAMLIAAGVWWLLRVIRG